MLFTCLLMFSHIYSHNRSPAYSMEITDAKPQLVQTSTLQGSKLMGNAVLFAPVPLSEISFNIFL